MPRSAAIVITVCVTLAATLAGGAVRSAANVPDPVRHVLDGMQSPPVWR